MNRIALGLLAGVWLLGSSGIAAAQEALAVEGPGYPVGEGTVIHPTLGAELGFTDNVFYENRGDANMSGLLRLVASAAIASKEIRPEPVDPLLLEGEDDAPAAPAPQRMIFRAGGVLRYDEYLTTTSTVRSQRQLGADLNGHLEIAPQGTVAFIADERFVRDTRPTNFESFNDNNRIFNALSLALKYQPGGRTMNGQFRWENYIDYFEHPETRFANRMINSLHARYEWAFFPYTKAYADVSYGFIGGLGDNTLGGIEYKRSANPIRGGVGIATAIVEVFTVKAHVGWAHASYAGGASYSAPILGGEIGYRYAPTGRFVVLYNYDHRDSLNADFYRDHHLGAHVDHQISRVLLTARGELRLRSYQGVSEALGGGPVRNDLIFAVGARGQLVLRDNLAILADYRTEVDQTEFRSVVAGMVDDPSYVRTEITAGVRAAF